MRRVLAGLLSVAAVVAVMQADAGSSSAAPRAHAAILCPLEPAQTVTCCGPPVARAAATAVACCPVPPAVTRCPQPPPPPPTPAVTITSTPNPSSAGGEVTIRGISRAGTVALWQEVPGQTSFHQVATTTAGGTGAFKFVRRGIETNMQWYVVAGGVRSRTVSQRVRALVTISTAGTARAHRVMRFSGHVTPNHAGGRLLLEKLARGGWRTVASARINRASRYVVRAALAGRGRVRVRAVLPANRRNASSASRVLTLTVA